MTVEENGNGVYDTPQHTEGDTSSIGALWPPGRTADGRVKGIYTIGAMTQVAEDFRSQWLRQTALLESDMTLRRVQFRAVCTGDFVRQLGNEQDLGEFVEAVIPLDSGRFEVDEPVLVYFGKNGPSWQSDHEDIAQVRNNILESTQKVAKSAREMLERPMQNGYQIEVLNFDDDRISRDLIIDDLFALYQRFDRSRDDVIEMVQNKANIIGVARLADRIIAAGIAELATVPIGSDSLRIAEITEAATLVQHGNNGIYSAISTMLLCELATRSRNEEIFGGQIDLVFGECNGLSAGVLTVSRSQGRIFSADIGAVYNLPESGILHQQVPIEGYPRRTVYNDLVPTFLTRSRLYEFAQS